MTDIFDKIDEIYWFWLLCQDIFIGFFFFYIMTVCFRKSVYDNDNDNDNEI